MICRNSDFIGQPLPKDSISDPHMGPPTTPGPRAPHHLNPALTLPIKKNPFPAKYQALSSFRVYFA